MRWWARKADEFEVSGVSERLAPYGVSPPDARDSIVDDVLADKAVTLLKVMPRNQHRETVERLVSPNDRQRGRQAVDALIDAAIATEDERGRLRRIA